MARKKRKKAKGSKWNLNLRDERFPKITGIFFLFLSLCLFVALCSYLFTWEQDQDKILKFSWNIFFQSDLGMANWLGRFGAILSSTFIYWGFGVASFIFVLLFTRIGLFLLQKKSLRMLIPFARNCVMVIAMLSILTAFIFNKSAFPWGGAFGQSIYFWTSNFLGNVGMGLLMLALAAAFLMWVFNPNFENWSMTNPFPKITMPKVNLKEFVSGPEEQEKKWQEEADYKPLKPEFFKEHDRKVAEAGIVDDKGQIEIPLEEENETKEVFDLETEEAPMETVELKQSTPTMPLDSE
ncbi:MAG: DNA translocase FtsK 4TM domain-containing protein, partial [Bacteroidota bacterium]